MRLPLRKRFNANLQGNIQAFMLKHSVKADDVQLLCDTEGNLSKQTHARRNYLTVYGTVLFTVFASVWMTHIIRQSQQALTESLCKRLYFCCCARFVVLTSPPPFPPAPHFCSFSVCTQAVIYMFSLRIQPSKTEY